MLELTWHIWALLDAEITWSPCSPKIPWSLSPPKIRCIGSIQLLSKLHIKLVIYPSVIPLWLVITLAIIWALSTMVKLRAIKNALMKYSGWWKIPVVHIVQDSTPTDPCHGEKSSRIVDGLIESWASGNLGSSLWFLIQSQSHESMSWWIIRKMHQVSCFRMIHHYEYINLHQSMFFETKKYTKCFEQVPKCAKCVLYQIISDHPMLWWAPGLALVLGGDPGASGAWKSGFLGAKA